MTSTDIAMLYTVTDTDISNNGKEYVCFTSLFIGHLFLIVVGVYSK